MSVLSYAAAPSSSLPVLNTWCVRALHVAALYCAVIISLLIALTDEHTGVSSQVRPPMAPTHFFLIDVSYIAVSSGATAASCASVARVLDDLPGALRLVIVRNHGCLSQWHRVSLPHCLGQLCRVRQWFQHLRTLAVAGGDRAQVAVATFDSTIHFYTLRATQTQPQMLVVPDVGDPYAPPAASVICNAKASRHVVCYC